MCKLGVISQEQLKIDVNLLLSANRKSYMPRRLAQQRITLNDLEWPFYASRAFSAVAELLVYNMRTTWLSSNAMICCPTNSVKVLKVKKCRNQLVWQTEMTVAAAKIWMYRAVSSQIFWTNCAVHSNLCCGAVLIVSYRSDRQHFTLTTCNLLSPRTSSPRTNFAVTECRCVSAAADGNASTDDCYDDHQNSRHGDYSPVSPIRSAVLRQWGDWRSAVICDYEDQHVYISRNKHILAIYLAAASCSSMIVAVCYMLYILPVAFNMGYSQAAFLRITHLSPYKAAFMFRCYWSLVTLFLPLSLCVVLTLVLHITSHRLDIVTLFRVADLVGRAGE